MNNLVKSFENSEKYKEIVRELTKSKSDLSIFGLTDSLEAHLVYSLTNNINKSSCIICSNSMNAKKMVQDLKFVSDVEVLYFPARQITYYSVDAESKDIENMRMEVINKVISGKRIIIVTTVDAIMQKCMRLDKYNLDKIELSVGKKVKIDSILEALSNLGYERASFVEGKGQFSVRGDIIDIFSANDDLPHRIEISFDEVESIRTFDTVTQRSIDNVKEFELSNVSEFSFTEADKEKLIQRLTEEIESSSSREYISNVKEDISFIENYEITKVMDKYFEIIFDDSVCFLENLKGFTIFVDEPSRCSEKAGSILYENEEMLKMLLEKEYLNPSFAAKYYSFIDIEKILKDFPNVFFEKFNLDSALHNSRKKINFDANEMNFYKSSVETLEHDIKNKSDTIVLLVFPSLVRVEQIKNMLLDIKVHVKKVDNLFSENFEIGKVYIYQGIISSGYSSKDFKLTIIAEQVTGVYNKAKRNSKSNKFGEIINSFEDLKIGDYVVHESHGIGIYRGIETVEVERVISDYMKIEYAGSANIFVPISQIDSIKKYMCDDEARPKLNTIGSKEWHKARAKAKANVDEVAKELVELYALRDKAKGFKFSMDTPWQKEFEDDFPYELTEDQSYAVEDVKKDMEDEKPMDRLLCGDVGYGKTEVAIRAAFKAVMDSKQVAYLVPTTVLSLQQYNTFKSRMEKFGIKVEMLSRFKSQAEQKKIVKGLQEGKVDIVIGTHRLLSKDVIFKDLGLLIIDEEHRFGVKAKETIKELKQNVDVLSMTATPIPRTLNMSMIGVRTMSTLSTPPLERMPVHTYVMEYDENIIKVAIERELSRDGQVFYINNRVENIEEVASRVRMLVPNARVAYAHGQMDAKDIEDIMLAFVNHEIDVIVCTTILESGIDIPNANTLIVEDADKLGLAALYQIRGRVGRSSRLAYAYITYKKDKLLSEISEKRLKAIKDFTEFGSGFKIAMRDLEIRGAGNILGKAQHGHMVAIGYEMYISMLEKAIQSASKKKSENNLEEDLIKNMEVKIDLPVSAYIPDKYIPDMIQKIAMYHKISEITNDKESLSVVEEMLDRYGPLPKETENLLKIVEIRNLCRSLEVKKISKKGDYLVMESDKSDKNIRYNIPTKDLLLFAEFSLKQLIKNNK